MTVNIQMNSSTHVSGVEPSQLPEMLKKFSETIVFLRVKAQFLL
jgi:hypothetical protein